MRLFLWCVLLKRESEKGGKTKKRTTLFLCTPVQTYKLLNKLLAIGYYQIMGSALFFVVELSIIIKNKTLVPPAGTILYSPSDRQRERDTHGSFELDRLARKQYYSWQNVRIISPSAAKREKERKFSKKEIERRER